MSQDAMADENDTAATEPAHHEPRIQVLRGNPTDAELAALVVVLGSAGGAPEPPAPERTRWGLPLDRLRFAMSNYQRLTLQQMQHLKQ